MKLDNLGCEKCGHEGPADEFPALALAVDLAGAQGEQLAAKVAVTAQVKSPASSADLCKGCQADLLESALHDLRPAGKPESKPAAKAKSKKK